MLWVKSFHIIFMVAWFSGLFYLPRLFIYHDLAEDHTGRERFKIMEWRLFYIITTPAALLTAIFGIWMLAFFPLYLKMGWMHFKLLMVGLLGVYHCYLGYLLKRFNRDDNPLSNKCLRILNEVPVVFLFVIVILVVVKPF